MSKTEKRKKYDSTKHLRRRGVIKRDDLKDLVVFHSQNSKGEHNCKVLNFKTNTEINLGPSLYHTMGRCPHKWKVSIVVIGRDHNNDRYFKVDEVPLEEPLTQHQMAEYIKWRHQDFADKKFNKNHLTNMAHIASIDHQILTNEEIDAILTKQDAWG